MGISNDHGAMIICWFNTPFEQINQSAMTEFLEFGLIIENNEGFIWSSDAIELYNDYQSWLNN